MDKSTNMTLNTIHDTLSSFDEITRQIRLLENRLHPAVPEGEGKVVPGDDARSDITLSELMDKFDNYIPTYCNTIINFKSRFEAEFLDICEEEEPDNEKCASEPSSKLDKCFMALDRLQYTSAELEDLIAKIRGNACSDSPDEGKLEKNIFCFLGNCNEILRCHKERMLKMICELSEMLLLEAS